MSIENSVERIEILGVPIDMADQKQVMELFTEQFPKPGLTMIVTANPEIVMAAEKDPAMREMIASADIIAPDGIGLVYASRIVGHPIAERVTGIDLLMTIIQYLEETGQSIFILGSKPGVAEEAARRIVQKHPDLHVAGTYHGYFRPEEEPDVVRRINESGADFLCVALGAPKQERFMADHREELKVRGAIGVGGSLDVFSGNLKRAPEFYQKHGLEWLYRLIQEPSRIGRMSKLPVFMLRVIARGRR